MTDQEFLFVAASGIIGGAALFTGDLLGYRRGVADGSRVAPSPTFDRGVRAGQWMAAAFLAGSNIPAVREVGRSLMARWGK